MTFAETFGTTTPIIGMVHLDPLPGAPGATGGFDGVIERAVADAHALETGGVDGLLIENFGDAPFYPDDVPKHVVASMTAVVDAVADATELPFGINVLRNDVNAALAIAGATGGSFVRVNVHVGVRVTDQGIIQGRAHETLRFRDRIAPEVAVFADLAVKHSRTVSGEAISAQDLAELVERGRADAVVVSGTGTGEPVDRTHLETVNQWRTDLDIDVPLLIGSGVTAETAGSLLDRADGAIVGTALKRDSITTNPVDPDCVADLVEGARNDA